MGQQCDRIRRDDARRRIEHPRAHAQHGLGEAIRGREDIRAQAGGAEHRQHALDRRGADRLGAAGQRHQAVEAHAERLVAQCLQAGRVGRFGRAAVRDAVGRHGLQPTQRPAQKSDGRHQVAGRARDRGRQHAEHQAVVVEVGQPAERPAGVVAMRRRDHGADVGDHVGMRQAHAARRGGGARGVLQVGEAGGLGRRRREGLGSGAGQRRRIGQRHPARHREGGRIQRGGRGIEQRCAGQHQRGARIRDQAAQARRRVVQPDRIGRRNRHRDPPREQAGPEHAHEVQSGRKGEQHPVAGVGLGREPGGDGVDIGLEPPVAALLRDAQVILEKAVGQLVRMRLALQVEQRRQRFGQHAWRSRGQGGLGRRMKHGWIGPRERGSCR
jgi:hypothetical protein